MSGWQSQEVGALGSEPLICVTVHTGGLSGLWPPLLLPTPSFPHLCCYPPPEGNGTNSQATRISARGDWVPQGTFGNVWSHFCFSKVGGVWWGEQGGACVRAKSLPFYLTLCSPIDRSATWEARVEHRKAAATGSSDGGKGCCPSPRDA